uniref:Uncharacterized protein n=1 Tax=viral metagenome TaxID=1070528 RepID=A0A6M3KU27_9ZZZZ
MSIETVRESLKCIIEDINRLPIGVKANADNLVKRILYTPGIEVRDDDQGLPRMVIASMLYVQELGKDKEEAPELWAGLFEDDIHWGDCTQQAETCLVCLRENYLDKADEILSMLHNFVKVEKKA